MAILRATSYKIGENVEYKGQTYTFRGKEPYICLDGVETNFDCWSTRCIDCGLFIEIRIFEMQVKFSPVRRCRPCAKAWRENSG